MGMYVCTMYVHAYVTYHVFLKASLKYKPRFFDEFECSMQCKFKCVGSSLLERKCAPGILYVFYYPNYIQRTNNTAA